MACVTDGDHIDARNVPPAPSRSFADLRSSDITHRERCATAAAIVGVHRIDKVNQVLHVGVVSRLRLHDLRHTWATLALQAGSIPKSFPIGSAILVSPS